MKNEALFSSAVRRNPHLVCVLKLPQVILSHSAVQSPNVTPSRLKPVCQQDYVPFEEVKGEIFNAFPLSST